jgi:hypothetical protein
MDNIQDSNRRFNALGWGLLCVLWGITILFDSVPFGLGMLGTGLILLGANAVRLRKGMPPRDENTVLGILAVAWAGLELARPILQPLIQLADWDWAIFAILLLILGLTLLAREALRIRRTASESPHSNL